MERRGVRITTERTQDAHECLVQRVATAREFNWILVHAIMKFLNFSECVHEFAVSDDLSIPEVKFGKEQTFTNAAQWFKAEL